MNWQPIETLPHDTLVILYQPFNGEYPGLVIDRFQLRFCVLLFGIGLLFCGGYNIYRERLTTGAALIGLGALLGFWSLGAGLAS